MFLLGTALVPNLGGFLVMRLLSGLFSSVTVANFGGTIADLYPSHTTGPAMSLFLWAATCGSPMGYFLFAFVAQYRGWRDVLWAIMGVSSGLWVLMTVVLLVCGETRHSVLLMKKAERERKRTGRDDLEVPKDMKQRGVKQLFSVALTRPFRFLGTEAISKSQIFLKPCEMGLLLINNCSHIRRTLQRLPLRPLISLQWCIWRCIRSYRPWL